MGIDTYWLLKRGPVFLRLFASQFLLGFGKSTNVLIVSSTRCRQRTGNGARLGEPGARGQGRSYQPPSLLEDVVNYRGCCWNIEATWIFHRKQRIVFVGQRILRNIWSFWFALCTGIFSLGPLGRHFKKDSMIHHDSQPVGIPFGYLSLIKVCVCVCVCVCVSAYKILKEVYLKM